MSSSKGLRPSKIDTTFSTSAEIESFVDFNMKSPIKGDPSKPMFQAHPDVKSSVYHTSPVTGSKLMSILSHSLHNYINPISYRGQCWQAIKDNYTNNKSAFIIEVAFVMTNFALFSHYRRSSIVGQKKKFVYQQYQRKKFLEESLRIKTTKKIGYKDYFLK
ncbi:unnamed protein product [Moneuplotes crassus]|uniref:Uncharacterized protein n=1 Tax=Euplotes crassus TaxID=5936 RepID=A0AAD2D8Q6_EUPCR|nr:unnamed protein product [Moneuplotes crassus]